MLEKRGAEGLYKEETVLVGRRPESCHVVHNLRESGMVWMLLVLLTMVIVRA